MAIFPQGREGGGQLCSRHGTSRKTERKSMNYESVFSLYLTWASCWANTLWVSLKSWGSQTQKYMYIIQRTFKNCGCPTHPGPPPGQSNLHFWVGGLGSRRWVENHCFRRHVPKGELHVTFPSQGLVLQCLCQFQSPSGNGCVCPTWVADLSEACFSVCTDVFLFHFHQGGKVHVFFLYWPY